MSDDKTIGVPSLGDDGMPLSFEAWAQLSARMAQLNQDQQQDVLDERRLDAYDWLRCEEHYARTLVADVGRGRTDRADAYANECVAEIQRRRSESTALSTAPAEAVAPPDATSSTMPSEAGPTPGDAVPSFMQVAAAPSPSSSTSASAEDVDATVSFEIPNDLKPKPADALPFHAVSGRSPTRTPSTLAGPEPAGGEADTLEGPIDLHALSTAALPFAKASKQSSTPQVARMTVQTYASFCAELAALPDLAPEICRKYNVPNDDARATLDRAWRARLDAEPALRAEWERLFVDYRDWLLRRSR